MQELSEQEEYIKFSSDAHYIKREVLTKLKLAGGALKYSSIKPADVDGNAFGHHLKSLIAGGVVEKLKDGTYKLSPLGKREVDFYSLRDSRIKTRPISGTFILATSADEKILSYKSDIQPLGGYVGLLFGKVRLGQSYQETLQRMLEARNLDHKELSLSGVFNIRYMEGGQLVAQRAGPVFLVKLKLKASDYTNFGTSTSKIFWAETKDINSLEILEALKLSGAKDFHKSLQDLEVKL